MRLVFKGHYAEKAGWVNQAGLSVCSLVTSFRLWQEPSAALLVLP